MNRINRFLLDHAFTIDRQPCVSPDFCLDWDRMAATLSRAQPPATDPRTAFQTAQGTWHLLRDPSTGDRAWQLAPGGNAAEVPLESGVRLGDGAHAYPATWENLLRLKNLVQEHDPESTLFPRTSPGLATRTIGVGARFTTLHWPAVAWAMGALGRGVTANQNSIPRELVYDVDAMLDGSLGRIPFPFLGAEVPEGHQGQSIEGMSHGAIITFLETGFHQRRIPWLFNADHQPVGGAFDARAARLVDGSILASYITFDLSPELTRPSGGAPAPDASLARAARERLASIGFDLHPDEFGSRFTRLWPSLWKLDQRDRLCRERRAARFTTPAGREYLRELSIDELPGLTEPVTTALVLAVSELLGIHFDYVAPGFGFQKNAPYPDNERLASLVAAQHRVCAAFDSGIGFHSGSGKTADNYRTLTAAAGGRVEIKTSGRYTYEMGAALAGSDAPQDQRLWREWYAFTVDLAVAGAFSDDPAESAAARTFITATLPQGHDHALSSPAAARAALAALAPSPDHMVFFEYNFLFVLAARGLAGKAALGDHTEAGYTQRARFYAISEGARLRFAQRVAGYLLFLAESIGLASTDACAAALARLKAFQTLAELEADIAPGRLQPDSQGNR